MTISKQSTNKRKGKELQEQAKKIASRPPAYTNAELMAWRLSEYIYTQMSKDAPLTVNGFYRSLGIDKRAYMDYESGDRDGKTDRIVVDGIRYVSREGNVEPILEAYRDKLELYPYCAYLAGVFVPTNSRIDLTDIVESLDDALFSEVLQRARLLLNEGVETRVVGGSVGDIMRAKVILGWQDEKTTIHKVDVPSLEVCQERLLAAGYTKTDETG